MAGLVGVVPQHCNTGGYFHRLGFDGLPHVGAGGPALGGGLIRRRLVGLVGLVEAAGISLAHRRRVALGQHVDMPFAVGQRHVDQPTVDVWRVVVPEERWGYHVRREDRPVDGVVDHNLARTVGAASGFRQSEDQLLLAGINR